MARVVCKEYKISCAEIIIREDITVDQFIDAIEGNRSYMPVLYVMNKIDSITIEELDILDQMPVSNTLALLGAPGRVECDKCSYLLCALFHLELRPYFLKEHVELGRTHGRDLAPMQHDSYLPQTTRPNPRLWYV